MWSYTSINIVYKIEYVVCCIYQLYVVYITGKIIHLVNKTHHLVLQHWTATVFNF